MPFIIGLTGVKRSGKDTAGKILTDLLPGETEVVAFADPLKQYAYDLDPLVFMSGHEPIFLRDAVDTLGWEEAKDVYPQVRRTLQRLGTEVFRKHVNEKYWTDLMWHHVYRLTVSKGRTSS